VIILLGDFNTKVGRGDIFKSTIRNESLHEVSNDNGVRVVNFAASKSPAGKRTMFPHRNIHKYTWTSDGKTHSQIDRVLIGKRWLSGIVDVRSFRGADCDTNHYLVTAKVRQSLAVRKRFTQKFHIERFNLKEMNDMEVKEQCQVKISNMLAALNT
jgi:hypothetical protein